MSSAANDKRGKLEEEFSNRMYDAESSPSQDLWARIDHELTVQENGTYKKNAAFYRQLAAACIILLLLAGGVGAWYFSNPDGTGQQMATVAPATNPGLAATVSTPSEEETAGAVAATAQGTAGNTAATPAPEKAAANLTETTPVAPEGMATASSSAVRRSEGTALTSIPLPPSAAGNAPVAKEAAGSLAVAESNIPETADRENPIRLSRTLSQTIAALSAIEQKAGNKATLLQQSVAATGTEAKATEDFKKLNEQVMAHAKRMEEEQKAKLLAFNEETTGKKEAKKEKSEKSSRWSLGMAYAPGYFEQNIGLPDQDMSAASRLAMDPGVTRVSSISNSYMEEARDEYVENADPGFSYGFEIKTGVKLGKKLKLLTGLGFLQNTTRSKSSFLVQQSGGFASANGLVSGPSTAFAPSLTSDFAQNAPFVVKIPEYKVNHRYRYLTVPVEMQYQGNIGKDWFWYGGAGVAANVLVQATILTSAEGVKDVEYNLQDDSPYRRLQWSGRMSGGVGKRLADNMSVTIGPEFRSYFNTLLAEPENSQAQQGRPYAVGLNMAVNYDLSGGKKSR
ncbi:PorT family protein [Pontibacter toksunensis]|uniref:PorT family protein n=1 Tax=Pontibacter toksunensis TaxID=1332631 RepID=A0ABW6BVZ2_9BACT